MCLEDRLRGIQGEAGQPRGKWLQMEMEEYRRKHSIDMEAEPTDAEIKMGIKLPNPEKLEEFKEPVIISILTITTTITRCGSGRWWRVTRCCTTPCPGGGRSCSRRRRW